MIKSRRTDEYSLSDIQYYTKGEGLSEWEPITEQEIDELLKHGRKEADAFLSNHGRKGYYS